jgi:hypothetical protein
MDTPGAYSLAISIDGEHTLDVGVQVRAAAAPRPSLGGPNAGLVS